MSRPRVLLAAVSSALLVSFAVAQTGVASTPATDVVGETSATASALATTATLHVATTHRLNVMYVTNARRQAAGVRALRVSWQLNVAAQRHSDYQAAHQIMTHVESDGSHGGARITRAGLRWNSWGETIAAGQTSATQVVNDWMNSPAHRPYMLNRGYTMIGVGLTVGRNGVWYWTLNLAS